MELDVDECWKNNQLEQVAAVGFRPMGLTQVWQIPVHINETRLSGSNKNRGTAWKGDGNWDGSWKEREDQGELRIKCAAAYQEGSKVNI